jgi:phage repressor protein C with HTH and peptisase S24 domain
MGWATEYVERLARGETVQFRPHGNSMVPRIRSGQLCTVEPAVVDQVEKGDIVLCKVGGSVYLHLVKACTVGRVLIGNNKGHDNGWTHQVFGKLIRVED